MRFHQRDSCISNALVGKNDLPDSKDASFFVNDDVIFLLLSFVFVKLCRMITCTIVTLHLTSKLCVRSASWHFMLLALLGHLVKFDMFLEYIV